mmetsp:Transcript_117977/g.334594  ORF Transcript_117977/g.334594 Transcript_117977/m.334594 type:complete len:359 (-) Transcript_117977:69-1145(-)
MDRAIPSGNKLCAKRLESRRHELHRQRMRSVGPIVDTREPIAAQMDHVRTNLKKEQKMEERYSEIDRENRILLTKMSDIMKQQSPRPTFDAPRAGPQSLNSNARKKELLRITRDNQMILRRIQQAQPVYNHVSWEGTSRREAAYLRNCAEYPLVLRSARRAPNHQASELRALLPEPPTEESRARDGLMLSARGPPPSAGRSAGPEEMTCVLKAGRKISDKYYLIEMVTDGQVLHVSAFDGDARTSMELVVKEREHRQLHQETGGDYARIADRLGVEGGALVLEEPPPPSPSAPPAAQSPEKAAAHSRRTSHTEEIDADAMVVHTLKTGSTCSVNAEIDVHSNGDADVRLRGLTPLTSA